MVFDQLRFWTLVGKVSDRSDAAIATDKWCHSHFTLDLSDAVISSAYWDCLDQKTHCQLYQFVESICVQNSVLQNGTMVQHTENKQFIINSKQWRDQQLQYLKSPGRYPIVEYVIQASWLIKEILDYKKFYAFFEMNILKQQHPTDVSKQLPKEFYWRE